MGNTRNNYWLVKHNGSYDNLYRRWSDMKQRCNNKNCCNYKHYGGRGITVCDEWKNSYEEFRKWSINNGYSKELSIDRIDVNGNYEPNNCRWTDRSTQNSNMTKTHPYGYIGISKHTSKSCFYTRVKINDKCSFYYSSKSLNDCAEKRNEFIKEKGLLYPLNDVRDEKEILLVKENKVWIERRFRCM